MQNYEKVHAALAERLGYSEFYMRLHNLRSGPLGSLTSRVLIDNAEHHADEVVKLLIDYLDCMMEQIRREEPDTTTNYFTVTADGERMQFYAEELILDSDEPEWQRWLALRQRFLTGNQLEFESQYVSGPGEVVYLGGDVPKLLEEPLKDGRLAEWVTLTVILDNGDYMDWREYSRPYHQDIWKRYYYEKTYEEVDYYDFLGQRFWMNGLYNDKYVCGEVPFVQDEAAVLSISNWLQSNHEESICMDIDDSIGVRLTLAPNTKPEIITKALKLAGRFYDRLQCSIMMSAGLDGPITLRRTREPLSREEQQNLKKKLKDLEACDTPEDIMRILSSLQKDKSRPYCGLQTNEESVRSYLELFAELRSYFTDDEVNTLLSANTDFQELWIRHAAEKYTEKEIRLYRFGICVLLVLEGLVSQEENEAFAKRGRERKEAAMDMGWPAELVEKIRRLPEELKALKVLLEKEDNYELFFVGMNDLAACEAMGMYDYLWTYGVFIRISEIRLDGSEDIYTLEGLLNELSDIEGEARENAYDPFKENGESMIRTSLYRASEYSNSFLALWEYLLPVGDPRRDENEDTSPVLTNREYLEYLRETGDCWMEPDTILNDVVSFESMDMGTHARLRFRRENGRYLHEVSMLD